MVEIYSVLPNGETTFVTTPTVQDALDSEAVLIIIDDDTRLIYLWKGQKCSVAKKFIGARTSQQVRGARGLMYKVLPVDEGEEPNEFMAIRQKEVAQSPDQRFARPEVADDAEAAKLGAPPTAAPKGLSEDLKKQLSEEPLPDGFEQESVIVGTDLYGVAKSTAKILGKEVTKSEFMKTELPDGTIFDPAYGLRFLIKSGKVAAIELLKRKS
ncbi:MAG: hypothetical protein ACTSRW_10860 [Candidatus Helarchaeota archaeon]